MPEQPSLETLRDAQIASGARLSARVGRTMRLLVAAALVALGIRIVLVEPFNIPSASMEPGLLVGDFLFVDKTAYGWSGAALPFRLPLGAGRLFGRTPARGDVVVFKLQNGIRADYVKRLIALPGDRVAVRDGRIILNGAAIPCAPATGGRCHESLNGHRYLIADATTGPLANRAEITVPAGRLFLMGDNRANSADSRVPRTDGGVGLVPMDAVVGRPARIFFSTGEGGIRWPRIGQAIR
ncbi:signal peptidase I [Sandaracinobacteroides saxicola]|uniref:Signal peptidase I n=1 Tax=Sandaracinobacteroides saxicola TaxID=2759707 RepID=A0A7G5IJT9_9SPHN|nr:signal peptidase I [Sandaracinobacteroides saxicola]QMW23631.1 signal peptidase I [Sandaracinobacteroides saxicola]